VQADKEKVHVAVAFNRYRKDNSLITPEDSLYILEKVSGRWGVRGRSSFAKQFAKKYANLGVVLAFNAARHALNVISTATLRA